MEEELTFVVAFGILYLVMVGIYIYGKFCKERVHEDPRYSRNINITVRIEGPRPPPRAAWIDPSPMVVFVMPGDREDKLQIGTPLN